MTRCVADRNRDRCQVVIGVYGGHMAECVYLPPSSRTTVMEIFPPGVFVRDVQVSVGALDVRYFAWSEARWVFSSLMSCCVVD